MMKNVLKKMAGGPGAAVLALLVAAGACQAAVTINLSLAVDTTAKTWEVYATLTDPSDETLGLHGIGIDVWGSQGTDPYGAWTGDLKVNNGTDPLGYIMLETGMSPSFPPSWNIGFYNNAQAGTVSGTGILLMGVMQANTHRENTKSSVTYNNIAKGVGELAGSTPINGGTISWDYPVLVAWGEYTGTEGWINVALRKDDAGQATSVTVLPSATDMPTPTTSGASFNTFSPMAGDDYRASVYVPEPATLALLGLGGAGLILGRKRR